MVLGSRRNAVENSSRTRRYPRQQQHESERTTPFATVCDAAHPVPEMPLISTDAGTMEMPEALVDLRSIDELI